MSDNERPLTLGEKRVRINFNVTENNDIDRLKILAANFIDEVARVTRDSKDIEVPRLAALAMTKAEEAAMWAVKAVTAPSA
ncbi:hypothetical protein F3N42_03735 [Marinihelvus fidelis]|uniref:Acb2/Tad1 hairpin domain-containing protein n=1 Tax=Marinihelvus fidelis TaxID=2613842 RepID=A0A5N0TEE6_9GAMM|nr:hypothetical protein [Marinihelvus fidelis]KAA9133473.1 hypothetical protein F3N42_03735 [Marinihelvus fidelis]